MKKRLFFFLMLLNNIGFTQKKNTIEFQLGGVNCLPITDFLNNSNNSINSGKITLYSSILLSHRVFESNFYLEAGVRFNFKNFKFHQNLDTLAYFVTIYSQPKYRIISIPLLVSFHKEIDMNFSPISEKKRIVILATGLSFDFVKEFSIRNGMELTGKGFSIKTIFKDNFAFQSNTGLSFNGLASYPILKFQDKYLYLIGSYKYPFYKQNGINLNYEINGNIKKYEINKVKLQEISLGFSLRSF